jgi:AcrR family transcriptional regulator
MSQAVGKREQTRERIIASAGRGFRSSGYGGIGVDALAKEAGVTSGAFYANFRSKAAAFREVVAVGMADLRQGILQMREGGGPAWLHRFIDFYTSDRRTVDLGHSCALQSLTGEVARADQEARETYERELREIIEATAAGIEGGTEEERRRRASAMLAVLIGGVSMARAVKDEALSAEIAAAVNDAARLIVERGAAS